ncbi:MAG: ribose-5-phosphate isomerase RpiA [Thermaceae bacterium]|nr:ribose-5-phosphate isomerase RpiA [Thermaceae bacterium]
MENLETFKQAAAIAAVRHLESGMVVGLGTGSTAKYAVLEVGRKLRAGELRDVRAVPTSEATAKLATEQGIPLLELDPYGVDVAIDGADEIDPGLNLIKGLGGALLREKIVEQTARLFVAVADHTKLVERLGRGFLPLEIVPFGYKVTLKRLEPLGEPQFWLKDDQPFVTDGGNYAVKMRVAPIQNPAELHARLKGVVGVVETGLFPGMAKKAYVAGENGVRAMSL